MALIAHWKFDKGLQNFFPKYNLNHGFKYNWYNTQDYYNSNGHPQNETEMNEYFNVQNTGIILGGTEFHYDNICFGSSGQITSWGDTTKAKPSGLPQEYYQFEAIGYIYIPESGTYEFLLDSDDASDFFINNTKVADFYGFNGGGHGFYNTGYTRNIYPIVLEEGVYSFKARLEEGSGGDGIQISWKKPGSNYFKTIPKEFYSHQEHENGKIGIQQRKTSGQFVSDLTDIPQNFSISMWYKHNGAVWTSECMFGTRTGSNGFMFYRNSSDSQGYYRIYFWYNATDGTIKSYYQWPGMSGFQQDTWYHIVMVRTQDGYLRFYRDGVLYLEKTPPLNFDSWNNNGQKLSFHGQGNGSSYTGGDISFDDIKIYDHQLSYEEVKELSKQKILHYKMNTFEESTENLYGDISTSSILRPSRTIYEEETPTNSLYYKHTSGQLSSTWSGNSYGYSFKDIQIESGKKAQFTAWVYLSTDCDISSFPMSIEGATSTFTLEGIPTAYDMTKKGTWQKIGRGQVSDGNVRFLIYPRKLGVEDGSFSGYYVYGAIQVELKDHQTPYTPDIRNQLVLDSSGYDNHQELNLSYQPEWKDEEGIYGIGNYYFNNSKRISLPDYIGYSSKEVSAFSWFKSSGVPGSSYHIIMGGQELEISVTQQGTLRTGVHLNGSRNVSNHGSGLTDGNWHFIGFTYNGNQIKSYIDGNIVGTINQNGSLTTSFNNRTIGVFGSSTNYYLNGNLSDIRIYASQLSEEDIKELYYKKQQIDTNGNFYQKNIQEFKSNRIGQENPSGSYHSNNSYMGIEVKNKLYFKSCTIDQNFEGSLTLKFYETNSQTSIYKTVYVHHGVQRINVDVELQQGNYQLTRENYANTPLMRQNGGVDMNIYDNENIRLYSVSSYPDFYYYFFDIEYQLEKNDFIKTNGNINILNFKEIIQTENLKQYYSFKNNLRDNQSDYYTLNKVGDVELKNDYQYFYGGYLEGYSGFITNNFSISQWILKNNHNPVSYPIFWSFGLPYLQCNGSTDGFRISYKYSGQQNNLTGNIIPELNTWYHVVQVFDKTNGIKLYVNGELDVSTTNTQDTNDSNQQFDIGRHHNSSNYVVHGGIADFRIYNKPISEEEIKKIYNFGNPTIKKSSKDEKTNLNINGFFKEVL